MVCTKSIEPGLDDSSAPVPNLGKRICPRDPFIIEGRRGIHQNTTGHTYGRCDQNSTIPLNGAEAVMKYKSWYSQHISVVLAVLTLLTGCLLGCGSGTQSPPPPPPSLVSIQITPQNSALVLGQNQQFTAEETFNDGSKQDLTNSASWSSSNATTAIVNNRNGWNGLAAGIGAGSSTIGASLSGMQGSSEITVSVPLPRFAYAKSGGNILGYSVDPTSGLLKTLPGSPFIYTNGCWGNPFVLDPAGAFAYAYVYPLYCGISSFDFNAWLVIDPTTGTLKQQPGPFSGVDPSKFQLDPARRFLFSMYASRFVSTKIDGKTGQPQEKSTDTGSFLCEMNNYVSNYQIDRSGRFVLFFCPASVHILSYKIDSKSGAPTGTPASSSIDQIANPNQILIDVTGQFMYLVETDRISVYSINGLTGTVSTTGSYATSGLSVAVISPDGKTLYASHWTAGLPSISGLSIDPLSGNLQELSWSPLLISADPFSLAIDPSRKFLYRRLLIRSFQKISDTGRVL